MSDYLNEINPGWHDEDLERYESKLLRCPYCQSVAVFHESNEIVYGKKFGDAGIYICSRFPACDSYVGAHKKSKLPLGTLANKELRNWRKQAHAVFDPLWKDSNPFYPTRKVAYSALAFYLNVGEVHIGSSDIETCKKIIELAKLLLKTEGDE